MFNLAIAFITSFTATWLLLRSGVRHGRVFLDSDLGGVQKNHAVAVPRIGGVAIFLSAALTIGTSVFLETSPTAQSYMLLACALPAFGSGLVEDLTKRVSPRVRLLCALAAALAGCLAMGTVINRIDVPDIDQWLRVAPLGIGFTLIAVAGLTNAVNIIDGLNGLAAMVSLMIFASIGFVAYEVHDFLVASFALVMIGAIGGFLIWNFPLAQIFLGDGGAYFSGFVMAELLILLIVRHPQVSAWYVMVAIYPIFETLFSIYRRKFVRGRSAGLPDGIHLHTLVYRRVARHGNRFGNARARTLRNSCAAVYLWLLSLLSIVPATFFWHRPYALVASSLAFIVIYVWLYASIVRFRTPRWLAFSRSPSKRATQEEIEQPAPEQLNER